MIRVNFSKGVIKFGIILFLLFTFIFFIYFFPLSLGSNPGSVNLIGLDSTYLTSTLSVGLQAQRGSSSGSAGFTADWIRVRSYAAKKPTYSIQAEETLPISIGPIYTYDVNLNPQTFFVESSLIRIRVNVTHPLIDKVLITIIDNSSTIRVNNETMINVSSIYTGYTYEYNYTLPSPPVKGAWTIKIYANDTYNNLVSNQTRFFVYTTQWLYRRPITINNTANPNNLTDYQVKLFFDSSNIDWDNVEDDLSDIRFTYYNSTSKTETEIPYWIENYYVNTNATIWVRVPYIPANGYATIYVYYGNPGAPSRSNGDATFLLFDDFEGTSLNTSKWSLSKSDGGSISISNGNITFSVIDAYQYVKITSTDTFAYPVWLEAKVISSQVTYVQGLSTSTSVTLGGLNANGYAIQWVCSTNYLRIIGTSSSSGWEVVRISSGFNPGIWKFSWVITGYQIGSDSVNTLTGSDASNLITNYYAYLGASMACSGSVVVDWVRIRKYADPEPTISVGREERLIYSCGELNMSGYDYYLARDIIDSSAQVCINISANNVTLDCQNHKIDGIGSSGSKGILVDRQYTWEYSGYPTNVTIKNCILTDWGEEGIWFFFASNNVIENVILDSNFIGINLGMSMYNRISKVISKNNVRWGIYLGGNAWYNNISDSIFENNGWQGIYISAGSENLIYNNIFNNTDNFYIESGYYEYWNTTKQPGTNIWNSSLGYIGGNFWTSPGGKSYSDICNDLDADGFCDNPYQLDSNNFDYLPIARVVGQYFIVKDVTTYDEFLNQKSSFTNSSLVRIRANVSHYQGASAIDKVWCKIIDNSSSLVTIIFGTPVSTTPNGYTYECNYTIPSSSTRGNWNVIVYANDTSNWQVSNSTTFFVYLTFLPSVASPFSLPSTQFLTLGSKSISIFNIPQFVSLFQTRQVFQAFSFQSILRALLPIQSFTSFALPQLISSYTNIQASQTIPINYFKVLSTRVPLISSLNIQSISKPFLSTQISQTIPINYYYILLATIQKYQPLTFSSLSSLLQKSVIYQSFSVAGATRLTLYSFLSSSFTLPHGVSLLVKIPSIAPFTFSFYSSLYSSITVLHSINLPTIISLLSSLAPIQQFFQLIHQVSLLFAYNQIYIYTPYGITYGLNETVFINGTLIDRSGTVVPNALISLYYYKTSEGKSTETCWSSTTTDEYGNFNFTWYNENAGNWTLVVKYYAYGVIPFENSTSILTITPVTIQDISPSSWWYKENEKSFYTQIMNLTANVGIKDVKAFPSQDNITQPFYRSTLNGLYSECKNKEVNQSCLVVGRFRFPSPGNYTLNNTLTIYYQRGNLYVFSVLKNVSVENITKEDFTTDLSLSSTKYGDMEKNIRAGEPRHYAWLGDTTNASFMLNSSKVCTDVYVRVITPFGEESKYVGTIDSSLKTVNFIINISSSEAFRGFGMDSFVFEVNSSNGCYGIYLYPVRLLPPKNAELIIQAPDVVTAGSLFTIGVSYKPQNYSIFYPHVMLDLSGTFGFEVGTSRVAGGAGRCYNVMLWSDDYMPGVTLSYQTTEAGTVFTPDSLRIVPQYYYYLYDKYGFLNTPKTESYYVRKIYIGYGVLQPGDWKMYGAYTFMIGNFSAETGVIYSDWSLSPIQIYKFLDVTEVPQFFNVITNLYGKQTAVQLGTFTETKQFSNWIAFYPRNFPPFSYPSGSTIQIRTFPEDPSTYWPPCLSAGHSPLSPPFSVYVEYQKTGEDAFSVPAGQRLASILNEWVDPGKTSSSTVFQAIAPIKPGIYNITAIVYDDAETGLYWVISKTIRVISTLAGMQVTVSQEDFPAQEIWAKPYNNNVTMIRKVLVTNYQENSLSQVAWIMNPLPADATYISGARSGVIDFLPSGATVNPSNVTYVIPGVVYTISGLTYDSTSVDLGKNITGKVSFYVYDSSISTDFTNVKVNASELVPYDSVPEKDIITIDRIFAQQRLFYQIGWTSRTGYEVTWGLSKGINYVYTAKVHFYNNNSKDIQVNYYIPLVRLPEFDPRNIVKLTVDGETNVGFSMTRNNFIIILKGMTEGDHDIYMEYVPYVAPLPAGGGGVPIYPELRLEPKTYNYTGLPTNLTIWYELTCLKTSCSVFITPSGAYTSWVEIPKDPKYGWTLTGFLFIPKDGTARFPVYVRIPEATPDGYYNITVIAEDISTKVQAKATINIWISRVVIPPVPIYKVVAIVVLVLVIILYMNWEKVKKLVT